MSECEDNTEPSDAIIWKNVGKDEEDLELSEIDFESNDDCSLEYSIVGVNSCFLSSHCLHKPIINLLVIFHYKLKL